VTEAGLHARLFSVTVGALIVTVAVDPAAASGSPAAELALALATWTALELAPVLLDKVRLAVAIVPSAITFEFIPVTRQTYCPDAGELQEIVFPALEVDGPGITETLLKSAGENKNAHCTPAACAPLETYATGKLTVVPLRPEPDESLRVAVCPNATNVQAKRDIAHTALRNTLISTFSKLPYLIGTTIGTSLSELLVL